MRPAALTTSSTISASEPPSLRVTVAKWASTEATVVSGCSVSPSVSVLGIASRAATSAELIAMVDDLRLARHLAQRSTGWEHLGLVPQDRARGFELVGEVG